MSQVNPWDEPELTPLQRSRRYMRAFVKEWKRLTAVYESQTDPEYNTAMGSRLRDELRCWVLQNPPPFDPDHETAVRLDQIERARGPADKGQGSLFNPDAVVRTSEEGDRVRMGVARLRHAIRARSVRDQAHIRENEDWRRDSDYWNSRIAAFDNFSQNLTDIERQKFGYVDSGEGEDDEDQDPS